MRTPLAAIVAVAAALAVSACQPEAVDSGTVAAEVAAQDPGEPKPGRPASTGSTPSPDESATTMRYLCESEHHVEIIDGGNIARVLLSDGRSVDIARVADASPPLFAGEALEFAVGSDGATLGQDEVGGFDCRPA